MSLRFNQFPSLFFSDTDHTRIKRETNLYRIYLAVGVITVPMFAFLTRQEYNLAQYVTFFIFTALFFGALVLSYIDDLVKKNISTVLLWIYVLLTIFAIYIVHTKEYRVDYAFGLVAMVFSVSMVLYRVSHILIYYSLVAVFGGFSLFTVTASQINTDFLFTFFLVFVLLGFFSVRYKNIMQDEVRSKANQLLTLFNETFDAVLLVQTSTRIIVDCNEVAVRLFEVESKRDIIGSTREKFQEKTFSTQEFRMISESLRDKGSWSSEEQFITAQKNKKWFSVIVTTVKVSGDNYYVIRLKDVTAEHNFYQTLRESEERFRVLAATTLEGIVLSEDGIILDMNDQFCDLVGYKREALMGSSIYDFVEESDKDDVILHVNSGSFLPIEFKIRRIDGEIIIVESQGKKITHSNKSVRVSVLHNITERAKNLRQLEESEKRFRSSLQYLDLIAIQLDDSGNVLFCNNFFERITGYSAEEVVGKKWFDTMVLPQERDMMKERFKLGSRSAYTTHYENSIRTKDGRDLLISWTNTTIKNLDNQVIGVASIGQDVTILRRTMQELEQSEAQYRTIVENAPDSIFIFNCQTEKFVAANSRATVMFGYSAEEFYLLGPIDISPEHQPNGLQSKIVALDKIQCALRGEKVTFEWTHLHKSGHPISCEIKLVRYPNEEENLISASITDITERQRIQRELEFREKQYRTLIETIPSGIEVSDLEGRITYASPVMHEMLGFGRDQMIGTNILDTVADVDKKQFMGYLVQLLNGTFPNEPFTIQRTKINHGPITVQINWSLLLDEHGNKEGVIASITDVTELKKAEEERFRLNIMEESNRQLRMEMRERRKIEQKLRDTEKYTRSIIDSSIDMICASDINGNIIEFNKAAERTFGYKAEEVIGKNASILYSQFNQHQDVRAKLIEERGFYSGEIINVRKDGEEFYTYLSASVLRDESGFPIGMMGVSRDITQLKMAEEELRMSEERYRDLFENASDLIQSVDMLGNIQYVNTAWRNLLGYTEAEVEGMNIWSIIHFDSVAHCQKMFGELMDGVEQKDVEIDFKTRDGYKVVVRGNISIRIQEGKPVSTRGIFRDITERKAIEEAIKESEANYRALYQQAYIGIARVGLEDNILQVNERLCQILGRERTQLVGQSIISVTVPDDARVGLEMRELLNGEKPNTSYQKRFVKSNGEIIISNTTVTLVRNHLNLPDYFVFVIDDITDRVTAERKLKESLKEKEVLLKEVHHRVKNNLQVISSILNLQSSYIKDKDILRIFNESQNRIKSMSFIHESLYQTKNFSSLNFSEYVANLSSNLFHSYQVFSNLVELKIETEEVNLGLDQAIPCGLILNELITNSLKYAFPGGRKGILHVLLSEDKGLVTIEVRDDGVGMSESFNIAESETLGLQLVTSLVDQIDGKLTWTGSSGTMFRVEFKRI